MSIDCFNCSTIQSDCYSPNCISADGNQRPIRVVNKQLPGPSIQVCLNDVIIVNVQNNMNTFESTSLHWHGQLQLGTPHMDGPSLVNQCPIPPMSSFQYKFTALDRGTHFWHSHSSTQRADG